MSRHLIFFFLSLILHVILICVLSFLVEQQPEARKSIIFHIEKTETRKETVAEPIGEQRPKATEPTVTVHDVPPEPDLTRLRPVTDFDVLFHNLLETSDTLSVFNQEAWKQMILDFLRLQALLPPEENLSAKEKELFELSFQEDSIPPYDRDRIAEMIRKRNTGTDQTASITGILSLLAKSLVHKDIPPQFDFIPKQSQVEALSHLYEKGTATQMTLYTALDTLNAVTAEVFNTHLDYLVDKGFVTRKKISPQLIFTFFGIPFEMSRQNKRNPLYLYEPRVDKKQLTDYLQSWLFSFKERMKRHPADSTSLNARIEDMEHMLLILAR